MRTMGVTRRYLQVWLEMISSPVGLLQGLVPKVWAALGEVSGESQWSPQEHIPTNPGPRKWRGALWERGVVGEGHCGRGVLWERGIVGEGHCGKGHCGWSLQGPWPYVEGLGLVAMQDGGGSPNTLPCLCSHTPAPCQHFSLVEANRKPEDKGTVDVVHKGQPPGGQSEEESDQKEWRVG